MSGVPDMRDDVPVNFGKWKGRTPNEIATVDPGYVVWMHANVQPTPCSRELALDCEQEQRENDAERFMDADLGFHGEDAW